MSKTTRVTRLEPDLEGKDGQGVLCSFPQGFPEEPLSLHMLANTQHEKKAADRALTAKTPSIIYSGTNFGLAHTNNTNYTYGVGFYHKQKVQYLDVDHMFVMEQRVRGLEKAQEDKVEDYYEQRNRIVDTFGSKKRKRLLKAQQINRVRLEEKSSAVAAVSDALLMAQAIDNKDAAIPKETPSAFGVLPSHNLHTRIAREVYPIEDWLPQACRETMEVSDIKAAVKKGDNKTLAQRPQCVQAAIVTTRAVLDKMDKETRRLQIHTLGYLEILIRLKQQKAKQMIQYLDELDVSDQMRLHLRSKFLMKDGGHLKHNTQASNKLLVQICIALLAVSNFSTSTDLIDLLAADLQQTSVFVRKYFKEVGCKPNIQTKNVTLTTPLRLPKLKTGKRAKRT